MERYFEKVSFEEFKKSIKDDIKLYEEYNLPVRKTQYSAGYDFIAIKDFVLNPGEIIKIPTGYKASFGIDEMLMIVVRSSMGFKYNIRLCNQVGIIESDYYNNPDNEGHLYVALQNEGREAYVVKKGDSYAQGIFTKFLTCGDVVNTKRMSGLGSTNRKEGNENE